MLFLNYKPYLLLSDDFDSGIEVQQTSQSTAEVYSSEAESEVFSEDAQTNETVLPEREDVTLREDVPLTEKINVEDSVVCSETVAEGMLLVSSVNIDHDATVRLAGTFIFLIDNSI